MIQLINVKKYLINNGLKRTISRNYLRSWKNPRNLKKQKILTKMQKDITLCVEIKFMFTLN